MLETVSLDRALCLPAPDVEALINGRTVAAIPRVFIERGWSFVILSVDASANLLPVERQYRSEVLPTAKSALTQLKSETIAIKAWGKCESCTLLHELEEVEILSQLTGYSPIALKNTLQQRQHLFLACLRIYRLPEPIEVSTGSFNSEKVGKFSSLLSLGLTEHIPVPIKVDTPSPVLNDAVFNQRKQQLINQKLPLYPQLEELHHSIAQLATINPDAKALEQDIKAFLGWTEQPAIDHHRFDLTWIKTIVSLGNRSKDLDDGKSNYQAGTDFENVVRSSLQFLGFTIDYSHKGGAGGLDLFCSKPYPLVGECKAGKKIPNDTAVQLLNLGTLRLRDETLLGKAAKLIIGPGELTEQLKDAARVHNMAIINPETLEKLVKLQNKYYGSVDLVKLKDYLKPGQADDEVEKYIAKVLREIAVRSHLVQLLKKYLEDTSFESIGVETLMGLYFSATPPLPLQPKEMHEILIELSSPLAGYLGRSKGIDWQTDRFYFLRDLPMA